MKITAQIGLVPVLAGVLITLAVTAAHAQETGGVAASGTANAKITMTLSDTTMALGTPDPSCEGLTDGTVTGEFTVYSGTTGNQGCAYIWHSLTVTVKSNKLWTGTVSAGDGSPTSGITVAAGSFLYDTVVAPTSYAGCTADTPLTTTSATFEPSGALGRRDYPFYNCVVLDWSDPDGTINSMITYTVSQ